MRRRAARTVLAAGILVLLTAAVPASPGKTPVLVLVHSPLVGPATWAALGEELRARGFAVVVPSLRDHEKAGALWPQHVKAVTDAVRAARAGDRPIVLVAHSGAGVLLPAIRSSLGRSVATYLFIDAIVPEDGKSRLDRFESREAAEAFRESAMDGLLPVWSDADLKPSIPDDALRRRFVAELRPLPLLAYEEPLPVFSGWPDAPCAYLLFTPTYEAMLHEAETRGWPTARLGGTHFQMLVEPRSVADAVADLLHRAAPGLVLPGP